ncbi:hypothetical protein KQI84_09415 [bacterium]|nr:hypothetical protein [bacterium]
MRSLSPQMKEPYSQLLISKQNPDDKCRDFLKWLCFNLDFWGKYDHPSHRHGSLHFFQEKLAHEDQSQENQAWAAQAVQCYYSLVKSISEGSEEAMADVAARVKALSYRAWPDRCQINVYGVTMWVGDHRVQVQSQSSNTLPPESVASQLEYDQQSTSARIQCAR